MGPCFEELATRLAIRGEDRTAEQEGHARRMPADAALRELTLILEVGVRFLELEHEPVEVFRPLIEQPVDHVQGFVEPHARKAEVANLLKGGGRHVTIG